MNASTALLVIDVQGAMFDEAYPVYQGDTLLTTIRGLTARAREAGVPVIYVRHEEGPGEPLERGTDGWQVHPAIAPMAGDVLIDKMTPDSFHRTTLQQELEARNIQHLVITGIQTEICVDTTIRRAFSLGYKVTLVKDAHSTWRSPALTAQQIVDHHNGTLRWFADIQPAEAISFA